MGRAIQAVAILLLVVLAVLRGIGENGSRVSVWVLLASLILFIWGGYLRWSAGRD